MCDIKTLSDGEGTQYDLTPTPSLKRVSAYFDKQDLPRLILKSEMQDIVKLRLDNPEQQESFSRKPAPSSAEQGGGL